MELLARAYDQVEHKYQKGYTLLTLGWSDGYSFLPTGFHLLSSAKESNRYQEISDKIDQRTNGYKARKESIMRKMDAIGMVKQLRQHDTYCDKQYTLPELKRFVRFEGAKNIFGSLVVATKTGIPVKLVFVRNRNKKSECFYILSTKCSLADAEIVRFYGNRWSIECFYKSSKAFLKHGTEFQSRTYDARVSHTGIVFIRSTILEWICRNQNDQKTYGALFFMFCDDIQDMDLTNALQSLMALFVEHISALSVDLTSCVKSKVIEWMLSQASFIQALFGNICLKK